MGRLLLGIFVATALAQAAFGQASVTTDPVGFLQPFSTQANQINLLANSDTLVSIPFTRPPEFTGAIASVSGNVITVTGSPGWNTSPQQWVYAQGTQPKHYYALIGPGTSNPKEGHFYNITANGSNTLSVDTTTDDLSGIPVNAQVMVLPHWTFNTVFPATDANVSFVPSTSPVNRLTQILIPNYSGTGINLSAAATYYFYNGAWRKFGLSPTEDHGDDVLVPRGYFTVRNASTGTTLTIAGSVLVKKEAIPLVTNTSTKQDNFVSVIRPVDVSLDNLGLITSGAFAASSSPASLVDQLFVYNNAASGINKSASATYYFYNGHWRKFGQNPATDFGPDTIPAGSGFVIRKGVTVDGAIQYWTNDHLPYY